MRVLACIFLSLTVAGPALAQISPGELAKAHESLEGMKNCLKCHELGAGPSAEKCLACHREIAGIIKERTGYHFRVVEIGRQPCFECHSDHAGRAFELVHWPDGREKFDHSQAGWKLGGAHAALKCRDCHVGSRVNPAFASAYPDVNTAQTFLGLDNTCMGCHKDPHAGQFTHDCTKCHGDDKWKPASRFDHANTTFPLIGRHATAECSRCHTADENSDTNPIRYAGIAHDSCSRCHTDPHVGRLGADCATCHGHDAWKPATNFDHARTRYPLTGKHLTVDCVKCHASIAVEAAENEIRFASQAHDNCTPCHTDPHQERLGKNCGSCHTTSDWRDIDDKQYADFDHNRTRFALKGLHARVDCAKCHKTESRSAEVLFDTCVRCHTDSHEGQFAHRTTGIACEGCHNEDGFTPSGFTVADHGETRFALTGAHLAQPCVACHPVVEFPSGKRRRHFAIGETTCESCHDDIHAGQFTASPPVKRCQDCHDVSTWRGFGFNHDTDTSYRLEGKHRNVRCEGCHVQGSENGVDFIRYRGVPTSCDACHAGQNLQLGGTQ